MNAPYQPRLRVYRFELSDGRERYIETDLPYEYVDGRFDVERADLVSELTPWALCSLLVDALPNPGWANESQRKLAISAVVWGAEIEHAVAEARGDVCTCHECVIELAVAS